MQHECDNISMMSLVMLELENFISLIDVFSDVFRRGTANHHPMTSP